MSNIYEDYIDGKTKPDKSQSITALSTMLRNNFIARIKDQITLVKCTYQGWLMMNNGKNGKWINRWVELRDSRLLYYKDSKSLDFMNVIDIDGYDIGGFAGKPFSFVATKFGEKSYYFCTHTIEELKRWKKAIRKATSSSEQKIISLPKPGAFSFYINEKQLHIDIPIGDLYWWLKTLTDSGEARKKVINSFYHAGDGFMRSSVAITITINGKTLIGHLECINNLIILKFDSLPTSRNHLCLDNNNRLLDSEASNYDQNQSQSERERRVKEVEIEGAINELQEQLRSEKESTKMKEKEFQEALDKHANSIKTLQELLQSEKDNCVKVKSLADVKERELQVALEKGVKEHNDLEKMVQYEKDNAAKVQAVVNQKEQELQSALKELDMMKNKLQMKSAPAQSTTKKTSAMGIKPGKVHNLVALFSRNESNESREEPKKRRPFKTQLSLPSERKVSYKN